MKMIYSVSENIFDMNSGMELAQVQRTKILNANGQPAQLLTRTYNQRLARACDKVGLANNEYLNMFDYFQDATNIPRKEVSVRALPTLPFSKYHVKFSSAEKWNVFANGYRVAVMNVMGGTPELIDNIEYFDRFNNKSLVQYYDWRGFLSMEENYDTAGNIVNQAYLKPTGEVALEIIFSNVTGQAIPTMWKLNNYNGFDYIFDYEDQLFLTFLNELNRTNQGVFIADNPNIANILMSIDNPIKTVAYLHEDHLTHAGAQITEVQPEYIKVIQPEFGHLDVIAVATAKQAATLQQITESEVKVIPTLSFAVNPEPHDVTRLKKLVYVGRLARRKNIRGIIDTFAYINQRQPDTQLVLKGFFVDQEYQDEIEGYINELKLNDVITTQIYSVDNDALFEDASLFISAATSEGLGMNALESMAYGIPVACYGVPYIKDNLVKDGVNGIATSKHTPQELGRKILSIFKKPQTVAQLQHGALATAEEFSAEQLVKNFDKLLDLDDAPMTEKRVDLSFVVPVYNVVKYLEATLDSIFNQKTKYDYEVICVDDGSTDGSTEILKQYAEKYSNLKFISQKNCGVGAARNLGLSHVEGEYVAFIDSDDLLADNYVETVMYNFKRTYADIVTYAARKIKADGTRFTDQGDIFGAPNKIYASGIEQFKAMNRYGYYMVAVWKYVTKTAHLREYKITFPNTQLSEDDYFSFFNYQLAKRTVSIKDVLYNYRIHDKSLIRTFAQADKSTDKRAEHYKAFELLLKQITAEKIKITPSITRYLMNDFLTKLIFKDELNTNIEHTTMVMVGKYLSKEIVTELQAMLREQYKVYVRKATVLN